MADQSYTLDFSQISLDDVPRVGGKNASLGQLWQSLRPLGIGLMDGFATTALAYERLLKETSLRQRLQDILKGLKPDDMADLSARAQAARAAVQETALPEELCTAILGAYDRLCVRMGREPELAVRSSATAEDLPDASFAGQQETFLNVCGKQALLRAVSACFASLFTARALSYRARLGYDHMQVALSVGIQPMVRSDKGCAGVIFTLDTESGFRDAVLVSGSYGLGEFVVQGVVTPDEWVAFKPTLEKGFRAIIGRRLGTKEVRLVYADGSRGTVSEATPAAARARFCLTDAEVLKLAHWGCLIEQHYSQRAGRPQPMDIEWAKDGITGELYVLQARPETIHSTKRRGVSIPLYHLRGKPGTPLVTGQAVGTRISAGPVRVIRDAAHLDEVQAGDVLVAQMTDPDWEPVMKRVAAIVTDQGGRTAHAAIVSRELGLTCIVGAGNATQVLSTGDMVTVSCAEGSEGHVYAGKLAFEVEALQAERTPATRTKVMLNVGDPDRAFGFAAIPNSGVGLARMEFIVSNHIGIHPMALARYPKLADVEAKNAIELRLAGQDPREFFIQRLSEGVARIAAAFYPKPVILRTSDFKTNEYAMLLGGREFEPTEENPMLGFRGASRYYDARYAEGFALECQALLRVRRDMGLTNLKVMIPFCRTVAEGQKVLDTMAKHGLKQHEAGLEVYAMCEIPSNVILARKFLEIFDGFSIGSNDLTQLVLGLDRDSGTVAHLFDERDDAVREMIAQAVATARSMNKPIGICGQAPSDYPDFAAWLVECGIDSISLNPDSALPTTLVIAKAEAKNTSKEQDHVR